MKVVINRCYGGFGLSKEAYEFLGLEWDGSGCEYEEDRANPKLVECVEKLKEKANGWGSDLKIVEVPDSVRWKIENYDGKEEVEELHRVWY